MRADQILRAITYANRREHEGAGYTLRIHLLGGETVEVDVYQKEGFNYLLRRRGSGGDGNELFFSPENVTMVEVLW